MTAATARTETSAKSKRGASAPSKAAAARSVAADSAALKTKSIAEEAEPSTALETSVAAEPESVSEPAEAAAEETVDLKAESIAEDAEPVAAAATAPEPSTMPKPSVAAEPESVAEPAEAAVRAAEPDVPEAKADAAALETTQATWDLRDEKPRFRIFIIDSGWNHPASKVLHENIDLIHALTHEDPIYVLDKEKSITLLRKNKGLIGHDPIVAVHDITVSGQHTHLGFRLHLGLQDDEKECLSSLKMFARFINTHRESTNLEADCRRKLHKEGLAGAIEIVGGAAAAVMVEG